MKNTRNSTPNWKRRVRTDKIMLVVAVTFLVVAGLIFYKLLQERPIEIVQEQAPIEAIDAEPAEQRSALEQNVATEGGQLQIYIPTNSPTLNPLLPDTSEMQNALTLVYENLINYDSQNRLIPSLAESWEMGDAQGLTWKINLRKEVFWHNTGDVVTANDVIFTMGLLKSEAYADSPYAYNMSQIVGFEALDENTLLISTSTPGMAVLHALTFPVVSANMFKLGGQPIGTGPYIISHANKKIGLEFTANEDWWRQPPYIKSVIARCIPDNATALGQFELGKINYAQTTALNASGYKEAGKTGMLETMTQQSEVMLINHNSNRLKDVRIRKAIAYALDRREIITRAYLNHAFACDVPIPPDSWLYDTKSKIYDYNPSLAAALLKESGWQDIDSDGILDMSQEGSIYNLRLRLLVNDTPHNQLRKDAASLIKNQLEKIGIAVDILASTWSGDKDEYSKALSSGSFDIALVGFNMDMGFDLSVYIGTDGANNFGKYSNATTDELLNIAKMATDDKTLKDAMTALQTNFVQELPFIQLYFKTAFILYSESINGIKNVRDTSVFNGVERWFFNTQGKERFTKQSLGGETDWASFDTDKPATQEPPT